LSISRQDIQPGSRPPEQSDDNPTDCICLLRLWKSTSEGSCHSWTLFDRGHGSVLLRRRVQRRATGDDTATEGRLERIGWDELLFYLHGVVLPPLIAASAHRSDGESFGIEFEHPERAFHIQWRSCHPMEWDGMSNWFLHATGLLDQALRDSDSTIGRARG
jgi:hypothetical protein